MKSQFTNSITASALADFKPRGYRVRTYQGHWLETGTGGMNSTWCDTAAAARILTEAEADELIRLGIAHEKEPV